MTSPRYKSQEKPKPRSPNLGGWRGSPASLAALKANRWSWDKSARCHCGRVAVRGYAGCYLHTRRPDNECSPMRLARRELERRRNAGKIPPQLAALDVFERTAYGRLRLAPLALALARAWDNRDNDPAAWAAAVRAARLALSGG
jgi:hypothetical protein